MDSLSQAIKTTFAELKEDGTSVYKGIISKVYTGGGVPNGGASLSIILSASILHMQQGASGQEDPAHLTASFLTPCSPGPCDVFVKTFSQSKRYTRLDAGLWQGGKLKIRAELVFTVLPALAAPSVPSRFNITVLPHTPIPQAPKCPLRVHPSKCTKSEIYAAANYRSKCVWSEGVGVEATEPDADGHVPLQWAAWWEMTDEEDDVTQTAAFMPFLVDQFRGGADLLPGRRDSGDFWYATYTLSLQFVAKFPLGAIPSVPISTPARRTVGCFARTRWINEGQQEIMSEIWSAPCGIGEQGIEVGGDDWRSKCQLLGTSTQYALPIPMAYNLRHGQVKL